MNNAAQPIVLKTSADVVAYFRAAGIRVRVRDLGHKFRICPRGDGDLDKVRVAELANAARFTNSYGTQIAWSSFNGRRELCAYKPGAIIRIAA